MAVFINSKGTTRPDFQVGKKGAYLFGGFGTPSDNDVVSGSIWLDKNNNAIKVASVDNGSVTWHKLATEDAINKTFIDALNVDADTVDGVQASSFARVDQDSTFAGNVTISGDLLVQGSQVVLETQTLNVGDNIITLNSDLDANVEATLDAGIEVNRGSEGTVSLLWDETEGEWTVGVEAFSAGTLIGDLLGDVTGNVTGTVSSISNHSTDNLSEGSNNLYYTTARANSDFDTRLASKTTSNLSEGTNLYYTDVRARAAISTGGDLSYDSSTGVVSFTERTDAEVRGLISASGDLSYNATTGVLSFTERTDSQVRSLFGAGAGLTYDSTTGNFSINSSNTLSVQNLLVANAYTLPAADGTVGSLLVTDGAGNTSFAKIDLDNFNDTYVITTGETWEDDDSHIATTGAITDKIENYGYAVDTAVVHNTGNETISGTKTFSSPVVVGNLTYTGTDGTSGQVLTTDGNGTVSFSTVSANPAGSNGQIQFNTAGSFDASAGLYYDDTTDTLTTGIISPVAVSELQDYGDLSSNSIGTDLGTLTSYDVTKTDQGQVVKDTGLPLLPSYKKADLPSNVPAGTYVFCPDATSGASVVFYNGTEWRKLQDGSI